MRVPFQPLLSASRALPPLALLVFALSPIASVAQAPAPGVIVERHRLPRASTTGAGDRTLTVVRVDLRRYALRFLSEVGDGRRRPLPAWVRDHGLAGGINAGMFMPDGRSVGMMVQDDQVRSARQPSSFEGIIGVDPRSDASSLLGIDGPGCGASQRLSVRLAAMRRRYRSVLQARRVLIDCRGRARAWDTRRYSAAAFGRDTEGRAVLVHVRTPYRMHRLAQMIASLRLGIRGLVYMEGGPEASLYLDAEGARAMAVGSWEDGFNPNDRNRAWWDLPNVIGFVPR